VKTSVISSRAGWSDMAAVRNGHIYEIPSTYILQPGPAALTEGVRQVHARLALVANGAHSTATFDGIKRLS
jgi:iron complex transport system substrate-binding protein